MLEFRASAIFLYSLQYGPLAVGVPNKTPGLLLVEDRHELGLGD